MEAAAPQMDVLHHAPNALNLPQPRAPLAARLRGALAVFSVGLGLLATVAWVCLLGWLVYRAVLAL